MVSMTARLGSVSRSPSGVSMAVHRVGKTLLIDELNAPLFFRGVVGHLRLWVAVAYSWVAIAYACSLCKRRLKKLLLSESEDFFPPS